MNGASTQKIRSHHETLTRENEKLVRQLHQRDRQQGLSNGKRVIVIEEDAPEEEEVCLHSIAYLHLYSSIIRRIHQAIVKLLELTQQNLMMKCLYFKNVSRKTFSWFLSCTDWN